MDVERRRIELCSHANFQESENNRTLGIYYYIIPLCVFVLMEIKLKLTAVVGIVAVLTLALAAGTVAHQ
jgi:hypothetical protein